MAGASHLLACLSRRVPEQAVCQLAAGLGGRHAGQSRGPHLVTSMDLVRARMASLARLLTSLLPLLLLSGSLMRASCAQLAAVRPCLSCTQMALGTEASARHHDQCRESTQDTLQEQGISPGAVHLQGSPGKPGCQ